MKDVNDLMQAILEMDAAQRRESEKARLERSARLAALDEQKQKIIAECDAREKSESDAAARAAEEGNAAALAGNRVRAYEKMGREPFKNLKYADSHGKYGVFSRFQDGSKRRVLRIA